MKIKNIMKLLLVAVVISTTGCQKYLDLDPLSNANGEQIWGTAEGNRQLLAGTYSLFRRIMLSERPFYLYGDLPAQTVLKSNHWISQQVVDGNYAGSYIYDSYGWSDWSPYYQVITTANTLLNHIEDVPDSEFNKDEATGNKEKKQIAAEAHFLYAYTYFWLVQVYGDVPLVKEAIESVDQALVEGSTVGKAQSSEKDVLEYCIKHLDAAIATLDYDTPGSDTWAVRADKGAAQALKAHVCLWLANSYKGTDKYRELVQTADDCLAAVIANGNRSLVDYSNPDAVTEMFNGRSSEGIFELNVSITQNETYWMYYNWSVHSRTWWSENYTNSNLIASGGNPQSNLTVADVNWSQSLYSEKDIRRDLFFENFGSNNTSESRPPMLKKYSTGQQVDPANAGAYFANSNVMLLRLTGIYLLRAEALYKLGQTGSAHALLNEIRRRSGIGDYMGSDLLAGIFEERARELVGEGHSAFDRIRNDYWTGCDWYTADRGAKKGYYWPVYTGLFSANRELVQGAYWQGKV